MKYNESLLKWKFPLFSLQVEFLPCVISCELKGKRNLCQVGVGAAQMRGESPKREMCDYVRVEARSHLAV